MSIYAIPNEATHAALVTIEYETGAPDEFPVGFGTLDECDRVARTLPAVAATSGRVGKSASVTVVALYPLCGTCGQRHEPDADDGGCS